MAILNRKEIVKRYYNKHKKKILKQKKIYNQINKIQISIQRKIYYLKNKGKFRQLHKKYYLLHEEEIRIYKKQYNQKHKKEKRIYNYKYYKAHKKELNRKRNQYFKKRKKRDIKFKLTCNLRSRISDVLHNNVKSKSTMRLIGCSIKFLKQHLEQQFKKGMSFKNYGKWHVDHIKPCYSFDLSKETEQLKCFNYKNLQPLWAIENLKKNRFI